MADPLLDVLNQILAQQAAINARINVIEKRVQLVQQYAMLGVIQTGGLLEMTLNVNDILTKVDAQGTTIGKLETVLTEVNNRLKDALANGADPAVLQKISDDLDANTSRIATAVVTETAAIGGATDPQPGSTAPVDPNAPTT